LKENLKDKRLQVFMTFSKVEVPYNLYKMKKHDQVTTKANNSNSFVMQLQVGSIVGFNFFLLMDMLFKNYT
jgi:hypothetical protein